MDECLQHLAGSESWMDWWFWIVDGGMSGCVGGWMDGPADE